MTPKKFTRGAFYVLFGVAGVFALYLLTDITIRYWDVASHVLLALAISGAVVGLFKLANWAFTPPRQYRDSSTTPTYANNKFLGDFPNYPTPGTTVGEYTYSPSPKDPKTFIWKKDEN